MMKKYLSALIGVCMGVMSAGAHMSFPDGVLTPVSDDTDVTAAAPALEKCEVMKSPRTADAGSADWTDWEPFGNIRMVSGEWVAIASSQFGYNIGLTGTAMSRENRNSPDEMQLSFVGLFEGYDLIADVDKSTGRCTFPDQELPIPTNYTANDQFYEKWHISGGYGYYSTVTRALELSNVWFLVGPAIGFNTSARIVLEGGEQIGAGFGFRIEENNNGIFHSTCNEGTVYVCDVAPAVAKIRYITTWDQSVSYTMLDQMIRGELGTELGDDGSIPVNFAGRPGRHTVVAVGLGANGEYAGVYKTLSVHSNVPDNHRWVDAGRGRMTDLVLMSIFDAGMGQRVQSLSGLTQDDMTLDVEVQMAEDVSGLYRVVNPYGADSPLNEYYRQYSINVGEGFYGNYNLASVCPADDDYYIVFDISDPEAVKVVSRPDGHDAVPMAATRVSGMVCDGTLISGRFSGSGIYDWQFRLELPGYVDYTMEWCSESADGYGLKCGSGVSSLQYADLSDERIAELGGLSGIMMHPESLTSDELNGLPVGDDNKVSIPLAGTSEGKHNIIVYAYDMEGRVRDSIVKSYEIADGILWGEFAARYDARYMAANQLLSTGFRSARVQYRSAFNAAMEQYSVPFITGNDNVIITVDFSNYAGDGLRCPATVKPYSTGVRGQDDEMVMASQAGDSWYDPSSGRFDLNINYHISIGSYGIFDDVLCLNGVAIPMISLYEAGQCDMAGGNRALSVAVSSEGISSYAVEFVPEGNLDEAALDDCIARLGGIPELNRLKPDCFMVQREVQPGCYTIVAVGFNDLGEAVATATLEVADLYAADNWKPVGRCLYTDGVVRPSMDAQPYSVEVEESVTQAGLYRLVNPYGPEWPEYNPEWMSDGDNHYLMVDVSNPTCAALLESRIGVNRGYGEMYLREMPNRPTGQMIDNVVTFERGALQTIERRGGLFDSARMMNANYYGTFSIDLNEVIASVDRIGVDPVYDGPAEYYNLQGMRIMDPTPGIYIVRRGSVVTKEYVR